MDMSLQPRWIYDDGSEPAVYNQKDAAATFAVGCSGQTAGAVTAARQANLEAGVGATGVAADPGLNVTRACFAFELSAPGLTSWRPGDYVVAINHTVMAAATQLVRVDICDYDGSTFQAVASNSSPGHTRGATGVLSVTVNRATSYTPQSRESSRVYVVLTYNNNVTTGASDLEITPDQTVTVPYDVVDYSMTVPQRAWDFGSKGVGGSDVAGSGVPAAFEIRRDYFLHLTLRAPESEWTDVERLVRHLQLAGSATVYPDQAVAGTSHTVYGHSPAMGEEIRPQRDGNDASILELGITVRRTTEVVFTDQYFAAGA